MSKNDDALRCADALNLEVMDYALKYDTALNAQHYIRSLVAENEAKDALLRQAVEAMGQAHDESLDGRDFQARQILMDAIAAIRQHLEGKA